MKKLLAVAVAIGLALALPAAAQTKWDLPTAYPANNFHTENIPQFAADVDKATGGKLKIQVHANASLFKAPEIKRAVQGGQAQIGEILLVGLSKRGSAVRHRRHPVPGHQLRRRGQAVQGLAQGARGRFAQAGHDAALHGAVAAAGHLLQASTLNSAADMKGLKWRAYSPATSKIAELVGAQPVTIQAAEVPQALATGVMDSYMSSGATGYDSKTYEHIKNFYDTQAWLPKNVVIVNKAFDALDKPTQAAVLKAAADAEARGWKTSEEKNGWYLEQLKNKGMTIAQPSAQLKADLRKIGDSMLAEWQRKARRRRPEGDRGLSRIAIEPPPSCATLLDRLYDAAGYLAAFFMVGTLAMVLVGIVGRLLELPPARHRRLRRLLHGGRRLPRARAHVEARRAHPRHAPARALRGRARTRARAVGARGRHRASPPRSRSTACAWRSSRGSSTTSRTGNDATPLWIPQLAMAVGHDRAPGRA